MYHKCRDRGNGRRGTAVGILRSKPIASITANRQPVSAHAHINRRRAFPGGYLALRLAFLLGDGGRQDNSVVLQKVDKEHCTTNQTLRLRKRKEKKKTGRMLTSIMTILNSPFRLDLRPDNSYGKKRYDQDQP